VLFPHSSELGKRYWFLFPYSTLLCSFLIHLNREKLFFSLFDFEVIFFSSQYDEAVSLVIDIGAY